MTKEKYCIDLFRYKRYETSEVTVGTIKIGAENPIVVQSMTTTNTNDTNATVSQIKCICDAGGQLVRMTTQGKKEALNLEFIKRDLLKDGYNVPLVADVHFNTSAAYIAAEHIEKVRINPGNFADGAKRFADIAYTDESYSEEVLQIKDKLIPLLNICKKRGVALRIGTNHGSLSDRIMSRYGDTPIGMVESCMEYLRICKSEDFFNIVLSIKASNARIMVHTVRLLVQKMFEEDMCFPLHLGVTEAGEGEDGRIRSAVGIGALLADGIGDTIRVSLTENPENEIPVGRKIVEYIRARKNHEAIRKIEDSAYSPFAYERRKSRSLRNVGGDNIPVIIGRNRPGDDPVDFEIGDSNNKKSIDFSGIVTLKRWEEMKRDERFFPFMTFREFLDVGKVHNELQFVSITYSQLNSQVIESLKKADSVVLVLKCETSNNVAEQRAAFMFLQHHHLDNPVVLYKSYKGVFGKETQIEAACDLGPLFLDGYGDGIWIDADDEEASIVNSTMLSILQAARVRFSKPDYISCPGCGRTLFNLQETTAMVKKRTAHLKGLKVAVMGCIVNGPGEMADADYGYVGSAFGKVTLYYQRQIVKRNIPEEDAVDELVQLIKEKGDWVEPCR
ncbi:(E)-4-hydroxy-3-methylbut-2-enyl-diphosphate synthase [Plebeiibacterium marinum]|uniref:4-hydroxy-3-methylbut-2-en-1-yl diphosphate synthase (flavodoxin) n=1 Tax=Plebeiibacterium marinum TaxID=2992111 RepID=A0AAE3MAR0_9BACT|nr:(E)-4-hydroxy-3-methylbut-2-enyl-diphosphate synthase [Plebeiobacterium marinum]MCW3804438.1 (E)-4-hydroxy-3-methylbut-2-enyl-diphosphate synthase [Plebeiobacterium marinum]